jgi:hypothetical protein
LEILEKRVAEKFEFDRAFEDNLKVLDFHN